MKNQNTVILIVIVAIASFLAYQFVWAPAVLDLEPEINSLEEADQTKENDTFLNVDLISGQVANGDAVLLDVRTEEERVEDGYAFGSTHFDSVLLDEGQLPEIPKDKVVYVYCRSGSRAGAAKNILDEAGFVNVINIGGLVHWQDAGGEVVRN